MKKTIAFMITLTTLGGALMGAGCGPQVIDEVDKTKTTLRIANYNGGVGEEWLDQLALRFEEAYKDVSFEEGKMGVDVRPDHNKKYSGKEIVSSLKNDTNNHIYFTQALDYHMMADSGLFADITELVTETVGSDNKKIVDKLSNDRKEFLEKDGSYYAIPHYELYNGIQYDAGVFSSKKLYFSDVFNEDGTRMFINSPNAKKSCGPDGIYNTYDDGLPSSYDEFYRLIDQMTSNDVIPFIWTGASTHYTNMLLSSLFDNYIGADGYNALLDFEEKDIEIVTSYAGGAVQTQMETLTKETAYKVKYSAAMYYALEFCETVFKKNSGYFPLKCVGAGFTNINAQRDLWNSGLDGDKPIAMLIDGSYSYNEAVEADILKDLQRDWPLTYKNKDVRYMPMPVQYSGTVTEGKGKSPVLVDTYRSYTFINANTKGAQLDVAKAFLCFAYTDQELKNFTLTTNGIAKALNYDLTEIAKDENLCSNGKNMLQIRQAAVEGGSLVFPYRAHETFLENAAHFDFSTGGSFWHAKSATIAFNAFNGGMTATDYFKEIEEKWTAKTWADILN